MNRGIVCGLALAASVFAGCLGLNDSGSNNRPGTVFVYMTDYQSAALATWEPGATSLAPLSFSGLHIDVVLRSYRDRVFVIERRGKDAVTVLDVDDPGTPVANFSVGNNTNPYDVVAVNASRAYVVRYGSPRVLIVNPATGDSLGVIDLASYADADGAPEAAAAVYLDGRLYVALQLLNTGTNWQPIGPGKIVAINTANNAVSAVYTLAIWNPISMIASGSSLYVAGGPYSSETAKTGIDRVNLSTGAVTRITEAAALAGHPEGMAKTPDENSAWVVVSQSWPNGVVRRVDLATGAVTATLDGPVSPSAVATGSDTLMVVCDGNFAAPGVFVFNPKTGAKIAGPIATPLPPSAAVVVE